MEPIRQQLDTYQLPDDYSPGASFLKQFLWFTLGSYLLTSRNLPGSFWRIYMLRLFGALIGERTRIKPGLRVKYPWRLSVGHACWLGEDVWIDNIAQVTIEDYVCISQGVYLCTGNHNYRSASFDLCCAPICLASGSWLGAQSRIGPGVTIGPDTVVTLASVVLHSVPASSVVSGHPARVKHGRWT
jgi:putative colanic acid biosynthesis acetyltransferase WcaF